MPVIQKILIANRGEIAVRVIRTARKLAIKTVAVYSAIDAGSLHVSFADEAYCIGEVELSETYLNIPKIIEVAVRSKCDAVHPGYGFLAENPLFVDACHQAGLIFIGPDTQAMKVMGNKIKARAFVRELNIPMTDGVTGTKEELEKTAARIGFPVLLKAAAGGGGKGMRVVYQAAGLAEAIESTSRQAKAYFGDETVYIERYIVEPRHIEVQILGDNFGNVIHLFERECSIQRRYQKIIEESPSPTLTPAVRARMGDAAVAIGKAIGYNNAGTIEFLVDKNLDFYFLEMNTRIQVEHPVTEMVTGIDIVEEQIVVASGNPLRMRQEDVRQQGHAIECRIYAEDPANNFQPSPGVMTFYREPELPGIRIDSGIGPKTEIRSSFDPMICKLVVNGRDRHEATQLMLQALNGYIIHGIRTNITYLVKLLQGNAFVTNTISTRFCDDHTAALVSEIEKERAEIPPYVPIAGYLMVTLNRQPERVRGSEVKPNIWETIGYWRNLMTIQVMFDDQAFQVNIPGYSRTRFFFEIGGKSYQATLGSCSAHSVEFTINHHNYIAYVSEDQDDLASLTVSGHTFRLKRPDLLTESVTASAFDLTGHDNNQVTSPMPGKVIKILVQAGDTVRKGDVVMIIEAMKMENQVVSPREAVVREVFVSVNDRVESSKVLVEFEDLEI